MAGFWRCATMPRTWRRWNAHGIGAIDLLVVNLYPFEATVAKGADYATDLHREYRHRRPGDDPRGGQEPRACRRRRRPEDYETLSPSSTPMTGERPFAFRQSLAQTAYARTAAYDAAVSTWMAKATGRGHAAPPRAFAGTLAPRCATARTRISRRPSTPTAATAPASPRRRSTRARS
jgi:phosphoribosylaminoimidazolecarboxamide formyltransferase/IMP cyclohydrolase